MSTGLPEHMPRLLADIGGTNARFALHRDGRVEQVRVLRCADFPGVADAMLAYLRAAGAEGVRHAAIGIATPVGTDQVHMTNHNWSFSIAATREALGLQTLLVINDFTALALALPDLPADGLLRVGPPAQADALAPRAVIGPGTGLGVGALVPDGRRFIALAGEGGHVSFSPIDEREVALWRFARARHGHVSAERLLCGSGLQLIHDWLCAESGRGSAGADAAAITGAALEHADATSVEALAVFCRLLGTAAGNLALTVGARGGVYLGGGIVPRFAEFFAASGFRARFEDKGRFQPYLAAIPTYLIRDPWPGLRGVARALADALEQTDA